MPAMLAKVTNKLSEEFQALETSPSDEGRRQGGDNLGICRCGRTLIAAWVGPVPEDEIAWILFRRTWIEPRTQAFCNGDRTAVVRIHIAYEAKEAEFARSPVP